MLALCQGFQAAIGVVTNFPAQSLALPGFFADRRLLVAFGAMRSLDTARQSEASAEADAYASYKKTSEKQEKNIGSFGELLQESISKSRPKS